MVCSKYKQLYWVNSCEIDLTIRWFIHAPLLPKTPLIFYAKVTTFTLKGGRLLGCRHICHLFCKHQNTENNKSLIKNLLFLRKSECK